MKVTFWARLSFAAAEVEAELSRVPMAQVTVVRSLEELLPKLDGTRFLVLPDAPAEAAREVVARLAAGGERSFAMHFNSAGKEGFDAAGIPGWVRVSQAHGALAPTIAEHVMGMVIALNRQLPRALEMQRQGRWSAPDANILASVAGSRVLLVGLGNIGQAVARLASAFGAEVVAATRTPRPNSKVAQVQPLDRLASLLPLADIVVCCLALTSDTRHVIGGAELAAMKPSALLVNVGRGGLVDSEALADALFSGRLRGAALDVADPEPLPEGHRLWTAPNLIVTAHYSGAGPEGARRIGGMARQRLEELLAGND
ncbi:MAG: D-2-hydroxyacid dehydrogenase [Rhizobiaceae bacterium]|nr:D-2-hydroxyacid dehydrogenase [Rhizobiaceae bacterium]